MCLCVRSSHESADRTAIAPRTSGCFEARFHEPNPRDENPKTPRLAGDGMVRYVLSTNGTTSWMTYCSKLPVTGESTHCPQPQLDQPSGIATIIGGTPNRPNAASRTSSIGATQRGPSVSGVTIVAAESPSAWSRYAVGYRRSDE